MRFEAQKNSSKHMQNQNLKPQNSKRFTLFYYTQFKKFEKLNKINGNEKIKNLKQMLKILSCKPLCTFLDI